MVDGSDSTLYWRPPRREQTAPVNFEVNGVGFLVLAVLVVRPTAPAWFAWAVGLAGALLLGMALLSYPRVGVVADSKGLTVRKTLSSRRVPWADVVRQAPKDGAMDVAQVLELTDGRRLTLPGAVPAGTVDRGESSSGVDFARSAPANRLWIASRDRPLVPGGSLGLRVIHLAWHDLCGVVGGLLDAPPRRPPLRILLRGDKHRGERR